MTYLARQLLMVPTLHFVDDFGGVEKADTALSAFHSFSQLYATLGMQMKERKAQPPDTHQRILGVLIDVMKSASGLFITTFSTRYRVCRLPRPASILLDRDV